MNPVTVSSPLERASNARGRERPMVGRIGMRQLESSQQASSHLSEGLHLTGAWVWERGARW